MSLYGQYAPFDLIFFVFNKYRLILGFFLLASTGDAGTFMTTASLKLILHIFLSDIHVMQIFNVDAGTSKTGEEEVF